MLAESGSGHHTKLVNTCFLQAVSFEKWKELLASEAGAGDLESVAAHTTRKFVENI